MIRSILAVLLKEVRLTLTYRISFLSGVLGALAAVFMFDLLSRFAGNGAPGLLEAYGGDFFAFVLIGIAFQGYLSLSLDGMSGSFRSEQVMGTLEMAAASPTPLYILAAGSVLWQFLQASWRVALYLLIGLLLFGLDLSEANPATALLVLALSVAAFAGTGAVTGGFMLVYRQGNPVRWLYGSASMLLSGVYYPVALLPDWLRPVSSILPLTSSLEGMRKALLAGAGPGEVSRELAVLSAFCLLSIPAGILTYRWALRRARRDGLLAGH
jgi:ABC-2 type transport system permease protein